LADGVLPNNLPAPAIALPAREVKKNLRRDQSSISKASKTCGGNIQQLSARSSGAEGKKRPVRVEIGR
jgi:hypothetical protein